MAETFNNYDEVSKSGLIGDILYLVVSNKGKSKKYTDVIPLDGGTVGIAHFAVGGLAGLYENMDTQKYFGKTAEEMIKGYSNSCRPPGKSGNDEEPGKPGGWGCYSQEFWFKGMTEFVNSPDSKAIQDKTWALKMKSVIEDVIEKGWNTKRQIAIGLGISNSLGAGGMKKLAAKNDWDAEDTLSAYASKSDHNERRRKLIDENYPFDGVRKPKEPKKSKSSNVRTTKYIGIGDSQTPFIAAKSKYFSLLGRNDASSKKDKNTGKVTAGSEEYLWLGGQGLKWLKDALDKYPKNDAILGVYVCIGTNGVYNKNDDIPGLCKRIKEKLPNAKYFVVQGSWGWPSHFTTDASGKKIPKEGSRAATITEAEVKKYYQPFAANGFTIVDPPIGSGADPHASLPVYQTIADNLDKLLEKFGKPDMSAPPPREKSEPDPKGGTSSPPQPPKKEESVNDPVANIEQQQKKGSEEPKNSSKNPSDTEQRRNIFENQTKAKPIKIDLPPNKNYQEEFLQSFQFFPVVMYNGVQIEWNNIRYLDLSYVDNIPSINMGFGDTIGFMKDRGIPLDDSKISFFLHSRTDKIKSIHMDFKIIDFNVIGESYGMVGMLDINELYLKRYKSYPNMSTFELMSNIAKSCEMGFNSNVDNTDDKMTWINPGDRVITFIKNSLLHSYKSDETFLYYYIDFYYHMNFMDLEKEFKRNITNELGISKTGLEDILKIDKEKLNRLILSNDFALKDTNSYFEEFELVNSSQKKSIKYGYMTRLEYYDELAKSFLVFDIDPNVSDTNKTISLRGAPQDTKFFKENMGYTYMRPLDMDNVHKNYHYSLIQNSVNFIEMEKIQVNLKLLTPNFNLYRFQKIFIFFSNQANTLTRTHVNARLTGEWLITNIKFSFKGLKLRQTVTVTKRHLELSPDELKTERAQTSKKEPPVRSPIKNENPLPPEAITEQQNTSPPITPTGTQSTGTQSATPPQAATASESQSNQNKNDGLSDTARSIIPKPEVILQPRDPIDDDWYRYFAWQQGPSGAAQHYQIVTDQRKSYSIEFDNIRKNWPGGKVFSVAENGVTLKELKMLWNAKEYKQVGLAFVNVQRRIYKSKVVDAEKYISGKSKGPFDGTQPPSKNRMGTPYSDIKSIFQKYASPKDGLTAEDLVRFAMIENGISQDTLNHGKSKDVVVIKGPEDPITVGFHGMFQENYEYFDKIIDASKGAFDSGHKKGFRTYNLDTYVKLSVPRIIENFNSFKRTAKYEPINKTVNKK